MLPISLPRQHQLVPNSDPSLGAGAGELVKIGNRTECAILEMAHGLGGDMSPSAQQDHVLKAFPFSSERKRMSTLVAIPKGEG